MAGTGTAHLRDGALLRVEDLVVEYPLSGGRRVRAVSGVSLDVAEGETLGLVGESGCGKSTTARAIMQLPGPTSGHVVFEGRELTGLGRSDLRRVRRRLQMVFQDPVSSLNPRRRVGDLVAEPLVIAGGDGSTRRERVRQALMAVAPQRGLIWGRGAQESSARQCQSSRKTKASVMRPHLVIYD